MIWDNLREEEFEGAIKKSGGICVIPMGCIEKHGQHLPVGTDYIEALTISKAAAEIEDVVILPIGGWLGEVSCFHAFKDPGAVKLRGCIGIKQSTILTVLEELCDEIARNGFTKILLCTSHGGNTSLAGFFTRSQFYKKKDYITMHCKAYDFAKQLQPANVLEAAKADPEYFSMLTEEDLKTLERFAETGTGGGHADFKETALTFGTHPHLVAPDRFDAEDGSNIGKLKFPDEYGIYTYATWLANTPNAFSGFAPIGCTATIGEAYLKLSVDRLSEIFTYVKNDKTCEEVMQELKFQ